MTETKLITVKETASSLGLPLSKVYQLVRAKGFPSLRLGGSWWIDQSKLQDWIDSEISKNN